MAASLSRPDPSSPASVAEAGFSTSRRGFSQDEVRAFLTSVAAELGRLQERERQLEAQLRAVETEVPASPELDEETVASLVGEETLRVLQTARESASQIKIRAEENAAKILNDANDEVNRLRQDAEVEAARKRHDAASDAEAEVALAKQQGREMVNEARAYRERVLADLERRTKLARQQIDDLVHGRDRLLQVFERARLVAVDVTSELQAIDGPAEFVNFSPTTGPLPLMVPADDLADGAASAVERSIGEHDLPVDGVELADDAPGIETTSEPPDDHAYDGDERLDDAGDDADTDTDTDDADEAASVATDAPGTPARDANVVSLFRGRVDQRDDIADDDTTDDDTTDDDTADLETADLETADDATADDATADDATGGLDADGDRERPDVGGIFERLRSEAPDAGGDESTEPDPADTGNAAVDAEVDDDTDRDPADRDVDDEIDEPTAFTRRDEALVPLIVAGARKLKRVLADEQNGVLDLLRQHRPVTALDELLGEIDEHAGTYHDALSDELVEAAVAGAAEVGKRDSKTLRTTIRKGGALDDANAVVRDDLIGPLRSRLERAIADGDGDNEDITRRIRAVYREWKTQHIDDQLDDAFRFAYGGGLAAGVKPGTVMSWMIDPSEPTCPDCEDNSLAGNVAAGEAYPTGHVSAPAHAGCRCLTVPTGQ